ncbi:hypothetical protein K4F52_005932 [Lecanicillium sp. MT-2017a]|nr:hypothetical protein K4F52_005932 [Lecanicillium sp. MT-2017a]
MHHPLRQPAAPRPSVARSSLPPKTPEPLADFDSQPQLQRAPSPRPRFRLRKRTASSNNAPATQQFLASVAAADVPIPSIEEPSVLDEDMIDTAQHDGAAFHPVDVFHGAHKDPAKRLFSPPKTPAPGVVSSLAPHQYPDWAIDGGLSSLESSPEYESSRPSTARSTQTSSSLFSRFSVTSDELSQCVSPETEFTERFGSLLSAEDAYKAVRATRVPSAKSRKAPWTRSMSKHLWSTYMMYLQDPKVTPVRIGKSGIPPHGVCLRVAREAKRSWRKSRHPASRERNTTPTASSSSPVSEWPHTCAATRGHLRELCKIKAGSAVRDQRYFSRSPTPFGRTANRVWNRRSVPAQPASSVFSGSEMARCLTVCTSESMQINGPLAQLTASQPERDQDNSTPTVGDATPSLEVPSLPARARLGSPFGARSYGPSVSNSLSAAFDFSEGLQRQNNTTGPRRSLASPARLVDSRPNSQKRRQGMLEPRRRKRPSLGTDFWTDPSDNNAEHHLKTRRSFAEFSSTSSHKRDAMFVPRANLQELFESSTQGSSRDVSASMTTPSQPAPVEGPARLGSPFTGQNTSFSFPNRYSSPARMEMSTIRRPFATVQQTPESSSSKSTLVSRLAYIDKRLQEFRRPEQEPRRSQSPQ